MYLSLSSLIPPTSLQRRKHPPLQLPLPPHKRPPSKFPLQQGEAPQSHHWLVPQRTKDLLALPLLIPDTSRKSTTICSRSQIVKRRHLPVEAPTQQGETLVQAHPTHLRTASSKKTALTHLTQLQVGLGAGPTEAQASLDLLDPSLILLHLYPRAFVRFLPQRSGPTLTLLQHTS